MLPMISLYVLTMACSQSTIIFFDNDALIIEHHQTQKVSLLTPDKKNRTSPLLLMRRLFGVLVTCRQTCAFCLYRALVWPLVTPMTFNGELKDRWFTAIRWRQAAALTLIIRLNSIKKKEVRILFL